VSALAELLDVEESEIRSAMNVLRRRKLATIYGGVCRTTPSGAKATRQQADREQAWGTVRERLKRAGWNCIQASDGGFIGYRPKDSQRIDSRTIAGLLARAREVGAV